MPKRVAADLWPVHDVITALHQGDAQRDEAQPGSLAIFFSDTSIRELSEYEAAVRQQIRWGWQYGEPSSAGVAQRRELQRAITLLDRLPANAWMTALASFHGSGFVREAAVKQLQQCKDGSEIPFLILRCNDWVKPIAERAQQALRERRSAQYAPWLLRSQFLLAQLARARRNDLSTLFQEVSALLQSAACADAVQHACSDQDRDVRRGAFQLAADACMQQQDAERTDRLRTLLLRALSGRDLWLRIWAARLARRRLYGHALGSVLDAAQRDRSVPVRREALLALINDHPELEKSLLDPCASLRAMVRFYLRKKATLHFAAFYRQTLADALFADRCGATPETLRRICIAADGLGETAAGEHASTHTSGRDDSTARDTDVYALLASLIYDSRPRVRSSALRALVRLDTSADKQPSRDLLEAALRDPSARVLRTALALLTCEGDGSALFRIGPDLLWQSFEQRIETGTRRCLLRAMELFARWTRLGYLLQACSNLEDRIAEEAHAACTRALQGQIYTGPSASERTRIENALTLLPDTSALRPLRNHVQAALLAWA